MWALKNKTPYKVGTAWGRDKEGVHEWIVAAKGTFDIRPDGVLQLSESQLEPLLAPEYNGDPGTSSLRYDADLVSMKPTTDVLINGTAYAPNGRATAEFLATVRIGKIRKAIRVVGNRTWVRGALGYKPSRPEPIVEAPVVYERAYGGYDQIDPDPKNQYLDTRNPVGCGAVAKAHHRLGQPAPNFEYPSGTLEHSGPAGFGAVDSFWSPRRELGGTYDEAWEQRRRPLLPDDWDRRSLQCSPEDQRPTSPLEGSEPVELTNLSPAGLLRFSLPRVQLIMRTLFAGSSGMRIEEHRARLSTVIIEPDDRRMIMVWQNTVLCRNDVDYLEATEVREEVQT